MIFEGLDLAILQASQLARAFKFIFRTGKIDYEILCPRHLGWSWMRGIGVNILGRAVCTYLDGPSHVQTILSIEGWL